MRGSTVLRRLRLPVLAVSLAVALTAGVVSVPGAASASGSGFGRTCTTHSVPVALTEGGPVDQTIVGELCLPRFGTPETVQLLVHGATYNKTYWDFPYQPHLYSYARYANLAGYATFNVDIVGSGESSRPHSSQVTLAATAHALHQVITKLRAGVIGPIAFDKVIWVGHSMGSATGLAEISTYGDVDGFIATGLPRKISLTAAANLSPFPASLDPKFAPLNLDDGYLALSEQTRQDAYYYAPTSDLQVVAVDQNHREPLSLSLMNTALGLLTQTPQTSVATNITVPVLSIFGSEDSVFCAPDALDCSDYQAVQQNEAAYYPNAADLDVVIVPATGHNLNTHYTAPLSFVSMITWALTHVAP